MTTFLVENKEYSLSDIYQYLLDRPKLILSEEIQSQINASRKVLDDAVSEDKVIYGVNTGFGKLSQVKIPKDKISELQQNLILSHAVGVGKPIPDDITILLILLKIISLSKGYSGIRLLVVQRLVDMLNNDCLPLIPCQGSVGASGDLAPLSHMTLPLLGVGDVKLKGKVVPAKDALQALGWESIKLSYKEGLALINGTQFSTAYGVFCMERIDNLIKVADISGALSVEGLTGTDIAFEKRVHELKPHNGQLNSAENLYNLLQDSEIHESHLNCDRVQDMYSVRCMPQVHGASRDVLIAARNMIQVEVNSVSDNPLVFIKENDTVSAGHFHAEASGQAMDIAAIALAELGNICERRTYTLVDGEFGLPHFLIEDSGLNSGFMIMQVSAAAIASENKTYAHPSTIDSIPTGAGQEDHVSMAPWAGRKLLKIVENVEKLYTIEILSACQAIDLRKGLSPAKNLKPVVAEVRKKVPFLSQDRFMQSDQEYVLNLIKTGMIVSIVEQNLKLK
ncbi:MAG: histidine ammonia-lyase [Candidatus Marinimicrobia bacterium]|nr:histidine ammonia-lyase [Candidatus Neomarinimicrobiota bacterium]